jgi:hypothetical protein
MQELSFASLIILNVLSWGLSLIVPAGSYLIFWPMSLTLVILAIGTMSEAILKSVQWLAGFAGLTAAILLFAPLAYLLYVFLTLQPITVAAIGLLLSFLFLSSTPLFDILVPQRVVRPMTIVLLVCAISLIAEGMLKSHPDGRYPRPDTLVYSLDPDDHTASWISYDGSPDSFTSQFVGSRASRHPMPNYLAGSQFSVLSAPAPVFDLAPPLVDIKSHSNDGDLHKLQMTVRSQRNTSRIYLAFDRDVQPITVKVAGRILHLDHNRPGLNLNLFGMPAEGVEIQLELKTSSHISFWILDQSNGLPEPHLRPDDFIAYQGSDTTIVCRKYVI